MLVNTKNPTKQQILLFQAIDEELKKKSSLSDTVRYIIVSRFVDNYDFSNSAIQHKSASGWADMILSEINED